MNFLLGLWCKSGWGAACRAKMPIKMLIVDGISVRNRPWPGELRYFNKDLLPGCCDGPAGDCAESFWVIRGEVCPYFQCANFLSHHTAVDVANTLSTAEYEIRYIAGPCAQSRVHVIALATTATTGDRTPIHGVRRSNPSPVDSFATKVAGSVLVASSPPLLGTHHVAKFNLACLFLSKPV